MPDQQRAPDQPAGSAPAASFSVTAADVAAAAETLAGVVRTTPLEGSRPLTERVGGPAWLKCENLQRAGSFKIRGAYNRLSALSEAERARGVVAASAGNHAQGVALAASMLGIEATVFMPHGAALPKVAATRAYGADVRFHGETLADAIEEATRYQSKSGALLVHPYDHPLVVAGQGTVGLEILQQCPDVRTIVTSLGGGGLLAGMAVAVKGARPEVRLVGVQAAKAAAYPPSLAQHHPVRVEPSATMADGIAVPLPGELPFGIIDALVDDVCTVSEESLSRAQLLLVERAKLIVEPAGAAAVAAILEDPGAYEPPVVAVLSGGNIDPLLLLRVLRYGMVSAGRYLSLRMRISDRPGSLARLLTLVGELDASVVEVEHIRTRARVHLDEVEVSLQLETRGPEHAQEVISRLAAAGFAALSDSGT